MKRLTALAFFSLLCILPSKAFSLGLGLEQTFGTDSYSGSRVPLIGVHVKIDEQDNPKWLDVVFGLDTYQDDFVRKRFYAFEPKLKVYAEREAGIAISYRWVPTTDDFSLNDVGVAIHYVVFEKPHSDLQPAPIVEELEVGGQVRRKWYGDYLDINFAPRAAKFEQTETQLDLHVEVRNSNRGALKPNARVELVKSFYSIDASLADRPAQITAIPGLVALTQGYLGTVFHSALFWDFGRLGGFLVEPRLFYSYLSFFGAGTGHAYGLTVKAGASGFGVTTGLESLSVAGRGTRSFLTLGASVTF